MIALLKEEKNEIKNENVEIKLSLDKINEVAANQIQINNQKIDKLYELLERKNQFHQNVSILNNEKFDKLFEIIKNQQKKLTNEMNDKFEGKYE